MFYISVYHVKYILTKCLLVITAIKDVDSFKGPFAFAFDRNINHLFSGPDQSNFIYRRQISTSGTIKYPSPIWVSIMVIYALTKKQFT